MSNVILDSAIKIHLTLKNHDTGDGRKIESCLTAALNDARQITGRDLETGNYDSDKELVNDGSWVGAMCYMTILDQIGTCYKPKNMDRISGVSDLEKALHYFTTLSSDEILALYALRNAFFHDFSLINFNSSKPKLQHRFNVNSHHSNPLVILPLTPWDGIITNKTSENSTTINLRALGDLVELVYKYLLELDSKKELEIELKGAESELLNRYTFSH